MSARSRRARRIRVVAGISSLGISCYSVHGAGPYPDYPDILSAALMGPEWAHADWHYHHDACHASADPGSCDGDPTWEDDGGYAEDDPYAYEDEGDPYAYADPGPGHGAPPAPAPADVLFEAGSAELTPDAQAHLQRMADRVREDAGVEILLRGHTDGSGNEAFDLSDQRARSVREFLAGEGVAPRRIAWVGLGDSRPVAPSDSETGRRRNRRVEIVVREREPDPYS